MIESNERLQQLFPRRFVHLSQTGDEHTHLLRVGHVADELLSSGRDLFQQNQLKRRRQQPKLVHVERHCFLKSFDVKAETMVGILILGCAKEVLCDRQHAGHRRTLAVAYMRSATKGRGVTLKRRLGRSRQARVVVQPLQVFGSGETLSRHTLPPMPARYPAPWTQPRNAWRNGPTPSARASR